jgi:DNA mismatch repair protein MutL
MPLSEAKSQESELKTRSPIGILPDEVASKIAAGEVIERPASVVRELVDNAIDAGARSVRVEIAGGGRALIRVADDGSGVPREEMPRAFLRHATSKLRTADDLWAVRTLGFRGEALYSIAAVSRLTFVSRTAESQAGYEMTLHGGELVDASPRGAPVGTIVTVRDLFYNLPARLAFLKSAAAEAAHITALVQSYALAHPGIRFSLTNEGRATFSSPGNGDLRTAAMCVYGSEGGRALLPVGVEPDGGPAEPVSVWGYCSPPAHSRSNRAAMHFFVNERAISSRMLLYAVQEAYHSLLMVGRFPVCIINISLDPSLVDVNVHPAKSEVKFRDEREIFSAVQRAVRSSLTAHVPTPLYGTRGAEGWEYGSGEAQVQASLHYDDLPHPADLASVWPAQTPIEGTSHGALPLPAPDITRSLPPMRVVGQLGYTYIVAEGESGLYLIDQHAAHERVLYEEMAITLERQAPNVQPLLQPLAIEWGAAQWAEVEPLLPLIAEYGFTLEPFGEHTALLRSVPATFSASERDATRAVKEMLGEVTRGGDPARWREELAITVACHSAVRAGKTLTLEEMRSLLARLERCRYPRSCAHGRPTMLHISQAQLEREFGRRA